MTQLNVHSFTSQYISCYYSLLPEIEMSESWEGDQGQC